MEEGQTIQWPKCNLSLHKIYSGLRALDNIIIFHDFVKNTLLWNWQCYADSLELVSHFDLLFHSNDEPCIICKCDFIDVLHVHDCCDCTCAMEIRAYMVIHYSWTFWGWPVCRTYLNGDDVNSFMILCYCYVIQCTAMYTRFLRRVTMELLRQG